MGETKRLKKFARKSLIALAAMIVGAYLICAAGLKILEFIVEKNPKGEEAVLARSTEPHAIRVYDNGLASLRRRLEIIDAAKKSLELEFFIYNVDHASRLVTQALSRKAKEGVQVRVLVDFSAPVFQLGPAYAQLMKEHGVAVRYYNTSAVYRIVSSQHRSHRKLLIADGQVVLTGGRNIGDEYFDMSPQANFLDTDIEVAGPIVERVRASFDMYWKSSLSKAPASVGKDDDSLGKAGEFYLKNERDPEFLANVGERTKYFFAHQPVFTCKDLTFVTDFPNPGEKNRKVFPAIAEALAGARKDVLAESPYFVIRPGGMELLKDLRRRKVAVSVLTNTLRSTDAGYTIASLNWRLGSLAKVNLNLFGFAAGPVEGQSNNLYGKEPRWGLHSKRAVIDGEDTLIGTYNIDPRSANLNSELLFICRGNKDLASHIAASIEQRKKHGVELIGKNGEIHFSRLLEGSSAMQLMLYFAVFPVANLFDFLL